MKRIVSLLIAVVLLLSLIPVMPVYVAAAEKTGSSNTGDPETDAKLNEYGYEISLEDIEGYNPENGKIENTPFGSRYVESYTLYEPFYQHNNTTATMEAHSATYGAETRPSGSVSAKQITSPVSAGFKSLSNGANFGANDLLCAKTAAGDFAQEARESGIAMIMARPCAGNLEIFLAVIDPLNSTEVVSSLRLSVVPATVQNSEIADLISISAGRVLDYNENEQGISPDEIVVTYPVEEFGEIRMVTAVYTLFYTGGTYWKNITYWSEAQRYYTTTNGRKLVMTVGDVDEDGFDDILLVSSYGLSRLKRDKKLNQSSNTTIDIYYGGNEDKTTTKEIAGLYRAGAAVTDINNDGKPNLVVCGMQNINYSGSSATVTDKTLVLESNLNVSAQSTQNSTFSGSKLTDLETTLRYNPVVIKTEQRADDTSNFITKVKEDSYHSVMYDGMFVVAKTCQNTVSFAGGDRTKYTKSGMVLTDAYSGMVYTNAPSVSRDEIFMIYTTTGGAMKVYGHSTAKEFGRTANGKNVKDGVDVKFFALPNTDYDSGILRYEGWGMYFTDPSIKAILAAAPSFMDFFHVNADYNLEGNTSYSFSTSSGNGLAAEWHVGAKGETTTGVVNWEGSIGYQGSWSRNYTETRTMEFTAGVETLVVVSTVPVEVYTYSLFVHQPGEGLVQYNYRVPVAHPDVYATMTVPEYDKTAAKYGKQTLAGNVVIHTDGDPASYTYTDSWIKDTFGPDRLAVADSDIMTTGKWVQTTYNTGTTTASIDISVEDEQSHGLYFETSITGGLVATGGVEFGGSVGIVLTEGQGNSYSGSVRNLLPEGAEAGFGFQWKMKAFKALVDGKRVPMVTYEIQNCSTNPLMPINVSARGCEAYDEDGNRIPANKITWEEHSANADKDVSYAIMRKNAFTGALQTVALVPYGTTSYIDTKDLEFGTDYEYAVRTVKNNGATSHRYSVTSPVETSKTLSEYGAPVVSIAGNTVTTPVGTPADLQVMVEGDLTGRKIEYQWMRRLPQTYEWDYIIDETKPVLHVDTVLYALSGAEYRCVVMETIVKEDGKKEVIYCYSDVIKLIVE